MLLPPTPRSAALSPKFPFLATLVLSLLLPAVAPAQAAPHIRILDQELKALFERGLEQSPTLRALAADVEATPVLVFAECHFHLPTGVGGRLNFVTSVKGIRFVRVAIDCGLTPRWQASLLAHEIQHALEVGRHGAVTDVEAMESLYEEIGVPIDKEGPSKHFETAAAKEVQRAVNEEMGRRSVRGTAAY